MLYESKEKEKKKEETEQELFSFTSRLGRFRFCISFMWRHRKAERAAFVEDVPRRKQYFIVSAVFSFIYRRLVNFSTSRFSVAARPTKSLSELFSRFLVFSLVSQPDRCGCCLNGILWFLFLVSGSVVSWVLRLPRAGEIGVLLE